VDSQGREAGPEGITRLRTLWTEKVSPLSHISGDGRASELADSMPPSPTGYQRGDSGLERCVLIPDPHDPHKHAREPMD
jgi:hypothetical protein